MWLTKKEKSEQYENRFFSAGKFTRTNREQEG